MKKAWIAGLVALLAAVPAFADEEDPPEYKDRIEARDAYRRGYERGFERGYQRGLEEGEKRSASRPPPPPAPVVLGPIRITRAEYGGSSRTCNATRFVARRADGKRSHSFRVTNEMCGDPAHGARKTLEVTYYCGQIVKTASAREHQDIYLDCSTP